MHGDLRTVKIFKTEKGDYKLMPPSINPRKKDSFYYYSPEKYKAQNFRAPCDKADIDKFKSEIFTLGMLMLRIGSFDLVQFN